MSHHKKWGKFYPLHLDSFSIKDKDKDLVIEELPGKRGLFR